MKVFTMINLSDIRRSDIFRGYIDKSFHECQMNVFVGDWSSTVYLTIHDPNYQTIDDRKFEVDLVKVIGEALNMTPHFTYNQIIEDIDLFVSSDRPIYFAVDKHYHLKEFTGSYLSESFVWYTPCAVKYQRWSRFFNIFSVDMWICFALSLVLAVITVRCISNYGHKSQCHIQYYSRLTVSVCKHTAPLFAATSVLLLLGVLQCCDQHSVPGVPHHIPYRTGI
jgi:hypothetical protein